MSVLLETSLGEIVVDLFVDECPNTCLNFLKLCKIKYYNFSLVQSVQRSFLFQTGDPTGTGKGGQCVQSLINERIPKFMKHEIRPNLKHNKRGTLSMAALGGGGSDQQGFQLVNGSQFFITLGDHLDYLDGKHTVFGEVAEGWETLDQIENAIADEEGRPLQDIRIKHTIILDDPFDDPPGLTRLIPDRSPEPTKEMLESGRLRDDELLDDSEPEEVLEKRNRVKEAQARELTLEMIGDLPYAGIKPPENILFVCKLNPVTRDEDLELIFSRFGKINSCEIIRDKRTGDSLQYAFIEYDERPSAEEAYFKMQNVLIDDRRIHVDFSQSVSKLHQTWINQRMAMQGFGGQEGLVKRGKYRSSDDVEGGKTPAPRDDYIFESREMNGNSHRRRDSDQYRERDVRDRRVDDYNHRHRRRSRSRSPKDRRYDDRRGRDRHRYDSDRPSDFDRHRGSRN